MEKERKESIRDAIRSLREVLGGDSDDVTMSSVDEYYSTMKKIHDQNCSCGHDGHTSSKWPGTREAVFKLYYQRSK